LYTAAIRFEPVESWPNGALNNHKIKVHWNSGVDEILGDDLNGVTGVRIRSTTEPDRTEVLEATGYFAAIGHTPNTDFLRGQVQTNEKGYIVWTTPQRTADQRPRGVCCRRCR
jgi:thioredoxin reductase (NADPH)